MQPQSSPTPSSAYLAAKEKLAAMSQEELARHKLELARQRAARERAAILAMRERTVRGRIEASGIPADYRDGAVRVPEVRRWVDSVLAGGSSQLVIRGTNGTGKTTEACAALMELAQAMTVRFAMLDSIKRAVDGSWINRNASPDEVLAGFMRCGCRSCPSASATASRPSTQPTTREPPYGSGSQRAAKATPTRSWIA